MGEQLYKKKDDYEKIYSLNYIENIIDKQTGIVLNKIINHIFISYIGNQEQIRNKVPIILRKQGLIITYIKDNKPYSEIYINNNIDDENWINDNNWEIVPNLKYVQSEASKLPDGIINLNHLNEQLRQLITKEGATIQNYPDDEDLYELNNVLKFKNKAYNEFLASGKGYVILRKNWVNGNNVLTQNMINKPNTIYEIRYDFDLNGNNINIPDNCILYFKGGSIKNGTIILSNTFIIPNSFIIEDSIFANIEGTYKDGQLNYDKNLYSIKLYSKGKWHIIISQEIPYGTQDNRPIIDEENNHIQLYYDTTINSFIYWNLKEWVDTNGYIAGERNCDGTLKTKEIII